MSSPSRSPWGIGLRWFVRRVHVASGAERSSARRRSSASDCTRRRRCCATERPRPSQPCPARSCGAAWVGPARCAGLGRCSSTVLERRNPAPATSHPVPTDLLGVPKPASAARLHGELHQLGDDVEPRLPPAQRGTAGHMVQDVGCAVNPSCPVLRSGHAEPGRVLGCGRPGRSTAAVTLRRPPRASAARTDSRVLPSPDGTSVPVRATEAMAALGPR